MSDIVVVAVVVDDDDDDDDENANDDEYYHSACVSVWQAEEQCHDRVEALCKVDRDRGSNRAGITSHVVRLLASQVRSPTAQK
jgi:hypothetical protein